MCISFIRDADVQAVGLFGCFRLKSMRYQPDQACTPYATVLCFFFFRPIDDEKFMIRAASVAAVSQTRNPFMRVYDSSVRWLCRNMGLGCRTDSWSSRKTYGATGSIVGKYARYKEVNYQRNCFLYVSMFVRKMTITALIK